MFNIKKKSHISVFINDYVIRALVSKGPNLDQPVIYEISLPRNVVREGSIVDEMAMYELIKSNVTDWGGRKQNVRFLVPDTSILLKTFEHPADVSGRKLKEFVQMELGNTIHLPFQEPLIDIYDAVEGDGKAVLFAAPPDEVGKMIGIVLDNHLHPQVADIRALCNLRLLEHIQFIDSNRTYLVTDWSINELSICIYSNGEVEFLRFQTVDTDLDRWEQEVLENGEVEFRYTYELDDFRGATTDQVLEIDRIMNFFKFSLHKGERVVDEIIVMGDHPLLQTIETLLRENLPAPIRIVDDAVIGKQFPNCKAKHATLLGLALKEVNE
ncbi:type IV pilus assembly protein PilM [Solibacillus isronensis B3W22]|uniref:Type IV pilus assembly protein PilM n=1 Tax=Solibacillus isronensis B3W22 TaxID=1224748 RepID=K1KYN4_9BACL|nr:pilus assembly protein PilM [Solibacillus isronensis]AMO84034.1 pilus assembly protein PilM [Solibacillus silvestris]EKB44967.1 type IV pilus assembly protein PilM [Solibacillus isronensis B3W22]